MKKESEFFDDCGGRFSFCRCTVGAKYRESNAGKKDLGQAVVTKDSASKRVWECNYRMPKNGYFVDVAKSALFI